jgi:hypothetical protein
MQQETELKEIGLILDKLLEHPVSLIFKSPGSVPDLMNNDDQRVLRTPMDLSMIKTQLESGDYNLKQFKSELSLIVSNVESYFGRRSWEAYAAHCFRQLYNKIINENRYTSDRWAKRVAYLRRKMGNLLYQAPILKDGKFVECGFDFKKKLQAQVVTEDELKKFVQASIQLRGRNEQNGLIAIIKEMEPDRLSEVGRITMDLNKLKGSTIKALIAYAKKVFRENGLNYP